MSTTYLSKKQLFIIAFMLIAVLFRLLPHLPNFTPITAIALFGGLYFSNKTMAYLVPLVIMALSDLFLGFHSISFVVYAAFIVVSFIGTQTKKPSVFTILLSSISFFIITNFGVWLIGYPKTWSGLVECYTLALPFFRNSLLGDLFYSGVMILGFNAVRKKYLNLA
ncbi:MAG: hypothetical protein P8O96_07450 [Flavobacteriaceae bacterium]|nr:hypothetical protein [Flavobacteriaceae bacterium]MDG1042669.1 hypothetical protein [Flavobacteriaceae bacterium]MDG1794589.1 hypothetical protein [Flavobacteriaceae bacterium]